MPDNGMLMVGASGTAVALKGSDTGAGEPASGPWTRPRG
jgi:hypothetical protein